jgi:hypothetical protein
LRAAAPKASAILGALGGKLRWGPGEIYEVEVRMRDGSVRTFRSATPSSWKPGNRVKGIMGKIEPALNSACYSTRLRI